MSIVLKSMDADLAVSRVSVLIPRNSPRSKSGDECTRIFFSSTYAFGNFLIRESLWDPVSILVEKLLFRDLRTTPATLFCIISERIKSTINTDAKSIDAILKIFAASFIYMK